jgi:hypothetical protein
MHGDKPLGFIKDEFIDYFSDLWILKQSAPWSWLVIVRKGKKRSLGNTCYL